MATERFFRALFVAMLIIVGGLFYFEEPPSRDAQPTKQPTYRLHYPSGLSPEEFLEVATSLHIEVAMPVRDDSGMMQCLPEHRYVVGTRTMGSNIEYKKLVWHPKLRLQHPGHMTVHITTQDAAYDPLRQLLVQSGMWQQGNLHREIFLLFPPEQERRVRELWKEHQTTEVFIGFQKKTYGQWEIFLPRFI